jgi:8-oxo-dGTP pyrophosphatase MutT (NUDIX family)
MYKVFINETPLILIKTEGVLPEWKNNDKILIARYLGKVKFLHNYIDLLEKSKQYEAVIVCSDDLPVLWKDFKRIYKRIKAAGGVVFNKNNDILAIYRRQSWDLPKGKIDKGETPEQAAVREVREETGLNDVVLKEHIVDTYHTYWQDGKRILKRTYWYKMLTGETKLTPQLAEDIEVAEWVDKDIFLKNKPKIYNSIKMVLDKV